MGEHLKLNINEIEIWSENPRHIEETENKTLIEADIINILVGVVGYKYMFNLAQDIFKNGLMQSIKPVVVKSENKYLIYDGNRRIACIKILIDPSILINENMKLYGLIVQLINQEKNTTFLLNKLKEVDVYSTSSTEALEIMDKTHGGIRDGIGTIPWDAYQKDRANAKRGTLDYPNAYLITSLLKLKKNDIKDDYTSYERIFGSTKFKELFKIKDYKDISCDYLRTIYNLVYKYKQEKHNNAGLSRIFNNISKASEEFYSWAEPQLAPDKYIKIIFKEPTISLFKGQVLNQNRLDYKIQDYNNIILDVDDSQIAKKFKSPTNENCDSIDTSITGEWQYILNYKKSIGIISIFIKDFNDPIISLKNGSIDLKYGESVTNLRNQILIGTNSINQDIINDITISSINSIIVNDSFVNSNSIGTHSIIYSYTDPFSNKQVSKNLNIIVTEISQSLSTPTLTRPLLSFDDNVNLAKYILKLDYSLRKLINEINILSPICDYLYILASSMRSIVALLYENFSKKINCSESSLIAQINKMYSTLEDDVKNKHVIKNYETWINEQALLNNFRADKANSQWLSDILNCGAHTSASILTIADIQSAAKKISILITYISILIY